MKVAVGTTLTGCPPHRSRRAALPHRALALGDNAQTSEGACRTPSSTCDRVSRPCVRPLVCSIAFPLARSLPSTSSAGPSGRPLFAGFLGTLQRSDSLHPCITVVPHGCTVRTCRSLGRPEAGPPGVRTPCCYACQRSPTPPGPSPPCQNGVDRVAFRVCGARRHPGVARLRGSILCLRVPLSTLRRRRYRRLRMTRGQCGWLNLHGQGLAPFTTVPACPGADPNAGRQARLEAAAQRRLAAVACTIHALTGSPHSRNRAIPPLRHRI
jgi:hypothetical protein